MVKFVSDNMAEDGLVCPPKDKKANVWLEKSKCIVI